MARWAHLIDVVAYRSAGAAPADAELVHAARAGDSSALGVLLDRHRAALYAHALAILGRREDAADAVQETFLLAVVRLHQLRSASAAGAWLHAIVRSVCSMQLRRPQREIVTADIEAVAERAEEATSGTPLEEWVLTALQQLPEPVRLATLLRYFGRGHSYAQIAEICDVPIGTVRSRLHQAKAELGRLLLAHTFGASVAGAEWVDRVAVAHRALYNGDPEPFVGMFSRDVTIRGAHLEISGADGLRRMCEQDLADGIGCRLLHVVTSADITVVEKEFVDPPDDPGHCPPGLTDVLFHDGDLVHAVRGYFQPRAAAMTK